MRKIWILVATLLLIPGVAYAGGGGVDSSGCAGYSEGTAVIMLDSCFSGAAHFAPGATAITIENDGSLPHTFTAVDGSFDTGMVAAGGTAELTFDEAGIYRVFCSIHGTAAGEGMAGVMVVGDAAPAAVVGPTDAPIPTQVTLDVANPDRTVVLVLVGLAAGLALAALLTALHLGITWDRKARLERLEPEVSS